MTHSVCFAVAEERLVRIVEVSPTSRQPPRREAARQRRRHGAHHAQRVHRSHNACSVRCERRLAAVVQGVTAQCGIDEACEVVDTQRAGHTWQTHNLAREYTCGTGGRRRNSWSRLTAKLLDVRVRHAPELERGGPQQLRRVARVAIGVHAIVRPGLLL